MDDFNKTPNIYPSLSAIPSNDQQFRDFLNLVLVCNDNGPRYRRTKNKVFLGTVITFSCILYLLSRNTLKQLLIKF